MAAISCTVNPGGGADYASLQAAETGMQATYTDLVADGNTITFNCAGGLDANAVTIDGWTVDNAHYITVNVATANRHDGNRASGYRIAAAGGWGSSIFQSLINYTRLTGLSAYCSGGHGDEVAIKSTGTDTIIDSCLMYDVAGHGIQWESTGTIANSIAFGCGGRGFDIRNSVNLYAGTAINNVYGIYCPLWGGTAVSKNIYCGGNATADIDNTGGAIMTFVTCATSDGSEGSTISVADCDFTNDTAGSENIHIASTSDLVGIGTDLRADAAYHVTLDFEGDTRAAIPCIGADEYIAAVTGNSNYYRMNQ